MKKTFLAKLTATMLGALALVTVGGINSLAADSSQEISDGVEIIGEASEEVAASGSRFATYQGYSFYKDSSGNIRCYNGSGSMVKNNFKCDGTYTYFFQADGTAMKDRLTYHPDGVHVIYFDSNGHEVFNNFANVKKTIAGNAVDDLCFFNTFGYMYVDVLTYDVTGTKQYYANQYGVMERSGWFTFSAKYGGGIGCANSDGTLVHDTNTYYGSQLVYIQGDCSVYGTSKLVARYSGAGPQTINNIQLPNANYKTVIYLNELYDDIVWRHKTENFIVHAYDSAGKNVATLANEITGTMWGNKPTMIVEDEIICFNSYGRWVTNDLSGGSINVKYCDPDVKWEIFIYSE